MHCGSLTHNTLYPRIRILSQIKSDGLDMSLKVCQDFIKLRLVSQSYNLSNIIDFRYRLYLSSSNRLMRLYRGEALRVFSLRLKMHHIVEVLVTAQYAKYVWLFESVCDRHSLK